MQGSYERRHRHHIVSRSKAFPAQEVLHVSHVCLLFSAVPLEGAKGSVNLYCNIREFSQIDCNVDSSALVKIVWTGAELLYLLSLFSMER